MATKTTKKLSRNNPDAPGPIKKTCDQCHNTFDAKVYWQRFCSLPCRHAYQYQITKRGRELVKEQMAKEVNRG